MKVLGKEFNRTGERAFELYLVDCIDKADKFVKLQKKNMFGKTVKLSKYVHTNGEIEVVSQHERLDGKFTEVMFYLKGADWYLRIEEEAVQLFVKEGYKGEIKTTNRSINEILKKYYEPAMGRIVNKRNFARKISSIARRSRLPFELVLAFKGDEEALVHFIKSVERAIDNCFYADSKTMEMLVSSYAAERIRSFENIGLVVPRKYEHGSLKIGKYVYECFRDRKIIYYPSN